MSAVQEIWSVVVQNTDSVIKLIWSSTQYVPVAQRERVALIAEIFTYVLVCAALGRLSLKLYFGALAAMDKIAKWTGVLVNSVEGIVRDSVVALAHAVFSRSSYSLILEWSSMTDSEAISEFAAGTKPRHAQRLLGFMVILAGTNATVGVGVAMLFVVYSQRMSLDAHILTAVASFSLLFGAFVFAFDRSIAGAGELFKIGRGTLRRNLTGAVILAVRVTLSILIAEFVAGALTILIFYPSIERTLQIEGEALAQRHRATMTRVQQQLLKLNAQIAESAGCKQLEDVVQELKTAMLEEANIKDRDGNGRKQRYEKKKHDYLTNQGEYLARCGPAAPLSATATAARTSYLAELREAEMLLARSREVVVDLGSGARALQIMKSEERGEGVHADLVKRLIFGLELMLLAVKLTLSSSYISALERLERIRAGGPRSSFDDEPSHRASTSEAVGVFPAGVGMAT